MKMNVRRENSAGYMTNWAARLFARAVDQRLNPLGLSSGQLPVFFVLMNEDEVSQKRLVDFAEIEQPTMAATLSRMERDGLITRRADPRDRRSALISLTPKARAEVEGIRQAIAEVNNAACGQMSESERADYLRLLAIAVDGLKGFMAGRTED